MRGFSRNRILLLVLATLALVTLVLFSSIPGSPLHALAAPAAAILQPVRGFFVSAYDGAAGFAASVFEAESVRRENEALRTRISELQGEVRRLEEAGRRWEALKQAFSIREAFADFTIVGCQVTSRSAGSWFDLFRVDAGERNGVVVTETSSFPVVDPEMNLVGRVYASDPAGSKILPILHQGSVVDGRIDRPGTYPVRVRGDLALQDEGLCAVDRIPEGAAIEPGDRILTSGEGGLYPAGIPIGTVVSVGQDAQTGQRTATLRPLAAFDTLDYLFILRARDS